METLAKLRYEILEIASGGKITDDLAIDDRLVDSWIHGQRALWFRNELNKNRSKSANIIQDLGCVAVSPVDRAECCSIDTGCTFLRTDLKIPVPIELHFTDTITRVAPVDKLARAFSFVEYEQAIYSGNGRFNRSHTFAFLKNNYIYLKMQPSSVLSSALKYINIQGIFEDPTDVARFTTCTGAACYDETSQYPINAWIWQYIKDQIVKSDLKYLQFIAPDNSNDASGGTNKQ